MKNREPVMTRSAAEEERLRALFAAADPPVKPSEALRRRVAAVTEAHARPVSRREERGRRPLLRIGLALAGAAAVALGAISVAPTLVAAQALRRMQAAISEARSMHQVAWRIHPDGSRTKRCEVWYQAGRWRMVTQQHNEIQVSGGGRLWSYDPRLNQVTVRRAEGSFASTPTGFTMAAMSSDFTRWGWHTTIRMLDDRTVAGRRVHQLAVTQPAELGRLLFLVDAATDWPVRIEAQTEKKGRWSTQWLSEMRYNEPLPASLFEPRFPDSARVVDLEQGRQEWEHRLAKGIARQHVGDRTIVIRDLQVNAVGDVFLLYTAGARPGDGFADWSVDLTDESGRRYEPGETFQPFVGKGGRGDGEGYVFDGQKLEGRWWVPVAAPVPGGPRRFTITFHVQPVTQHGPDIRPFQNLTESATFSLSVDHPATTLLPGYMPYMAVRPDEREVRISEARIRARYYRQSGDRQKLEKSLTLYQEIKRLHDEQSVDLGEPVRDSMAWLERGEVLRELGRKAEARAAFAEALREGLSIDFQRREAEAALQALR